MSNKKPHIRLHIDNKEIFDGDLDEWRKAAPEDFLDAVQPDAKPAPWLKAILIVMADAAMTGDSVSIEATTGESYWSMEVTRQ